VLEDVGLVRRDDQHRDRLWVLGPLDTTLFPVEAELEEQLKRTNPKGRLLEFCTRTRIELPQTASEAQGAFYRVTMSLSYQGETLSSGPQQAASKKAAEQLAAQALLEIVSQRTAATDVSRVSAAEIARLQAANPKGQLWEWCAQKKWPAPRFEQQADLEGYCVRAVLTLDKDESLVSAWHSAATSKVAEQAAAEALLQVLQRRPTGDQPEVAATTPEPPAGVNAAARLNELKQAGILQSTGYEVIQQDGPSHQPVFTLVAWATTPDGQTSVTAPVSAPSKKAGQRAAAERLLELLAERGITRR
jgi:dsRNA-specific ribonuclease